MDDAAAPVPVSPVRSDIWIRFFQIPQRGRVCCVRVGGMMCQRVSVRVTAWAGDVTPQISC